MFFILIGGIFFLLLIQNRFFSRALGSILSFILVCWSGFLLIKIIDYQYWYNGIFFLEKNIFNKSLIFIECNYYIIFDSLSTLLIFLTGVLMLVCIFIGWNNNNIELLYGLILSIIISLLLVFLVSDLLLFYVFFEAILIPMFLLIGLWGSRIRKITAAYRFFLYTVIGSILFLSIVIYLYMSYGITNIYNLKYLINYNKNIEIFCWFCLFSALAVKVPVYPLHTWLPEAHAEAPTIGSILSAGILLKLGPYGLIRFNNFIFPYGMFFYRPLLYFLCIIGVYYTSITALRQNDLKKIIAYSSIGHMALVLLGICALTVEGFIGSFLLLIAHGFTSAGLFGIVGLLYERVKTRVFFYYKGLLQIYPILGLFFFILILSNIGFPGTLNFISELLIIISLFELNIYICIIISLVTVIVIGFNLFLYGRIFYGSIEMKKIYNIYNFDLSFRESSIILILVIPIIIFGILGQNLSNILKLNAIFYILI